MQKNLDEIWEEAKSSKEVKFGGLALGTVFQAMEHSPDKFEEFTGLEVPENLFGEVLNPYQIDKGAHFYFSYSTATLMLESLERSTEMTYPDRFLAANIGTMIGGSAKELTDNYFDPGDMIANLAGANFALKHHIEKLSLKYEEELGVEIDSRTDFVKAEIIYRKYEEGNLDLNGYLEKEESEPAGI